MNPLHPTKRAHLSSKRTLKRNQRLLVEELEHRDTPAGNVIATVIGGDLILTGDTNAAGNQITITETAPRQYTIAGKGGSGTTVNGVVSWNTGVSDVINRDIKGKFLDGDDSLEFTGLGGTVTDFRNIAIDMGKGSNLLNFTNFVAVSATLNLPSDLNDQVALGNGKIRGNLTINHKKGNDTTNLTNLETTGNVAINLKDGHDQVNITTSLLSGNVAIINTAGITGNAINLVSDTIGKNLTVSNPGNFAVANTNMFTTVNVGGNATITNGSTNTGITNSNSFASFSTGQTFKLVNGNGDDANTMTTVRAGKSLIVKNGNGTNSTTISTTSLVGTGLSIDGGNGNDTILIIPGSNMFGGNVAINQGNGANLVSVTSATFTGNFTVNGGTGNDMLALDNSTITRNLSFNGSDGNNTVLLTTSMTIGGNVSINNKTGFDLLQSNAGGGVCIDGNLTVNNGNGGSNTLFKDGCFEGNVSLNSGNGDDTVTFTDCEFSRNLTLRAGNGSSNIFCNGTTGNSVKGNVSVSNLTGSDTFQTNVIPMSIGGNLSISNGNGASATAISKITVAGNTSIINGVGDDFIITNDVNSNEYFGGNVTISSGPGATTIQFDGNVVQRCQILGNMSINLSDGVDSIDMTNFNVFGTLSLNTGAKNDTIRLDDFTIRGKATFNTGGQDDLIAIETRATLASRSNFFGDLVINVGGGNDTAALSGASSELDLYVYGNVSGDFKTPACELRTIGTHAKRIGSLIFY